MVFVDTSAWYAFFVPLDAEHQRVRLALGSAREPIFTTDYCIDETLTLLLARNEVQRALEAGREFFQRNLVRLHYLAPAQIRRAWILFQRRAVSGWSFTDCTSKVVIDDLGIGTAAALDEHFRQFGNLTVVP
jgi:predicted nucleic acid-binding protein